MNYSKKSGPTQKPLQKSEITLFQVVECRTTRYWNDWTKVWLSFCLICSRQLLAGKLAVSFGVTNTRKYLLTNCWQIIHITLFHSKVDILLMYENMEKGWFSRWGTYHAGRVQGMMLYPFPWLGYAKNSEMGVLRTVRRARKGVFRAAHTHIPCFRETSTNFRCLGRSNL